MNFVKSFSLALMLAATSQTGWALDGEHLFLQNCAACHRPTGMGVPGAFPALAHSKVVQGDPKEPITRILHGRGGMPAFQAEISDADIAAILTYARNAWGNKAKPVTPAQVAVLRGGHKDNAKASLLAH